MPKHIANAALLWCREDTARLILGAQPVQHVNGRPVELIPRRPTLLVYTGTNVMVPKVEDWFYVEIDPDALRTA